VNFVDQELYGRLVKSLTNIAPSAEQIERIEGIRSGAKLLLGRILEMSPTASRERSLALTHLEETVMWAVKSIVLEGV
jgi:hypothetical protein